VLFSAKGRADDAMLQEDPVFVGAKLTPEWADNDHI
jgi:hypothetical protein